MIAAEYELGPESCNCLAVRQASRHVTQLHDQCLAPFGLRATQFSVLAKLKRKGPLALSGLAHEMVMDRTTLGRNTLPLQREGLVTIVQDKSDRRLKELRLTESGAERLTSASRAWSQAQARFESAVGSQ
jgi:DNA-binding MarR family transcriptional regulator